MAIDLILLDIEVVLNFIMDIVFTLYILIVLNQPAILVAQVDSCQILDHHFRLSEGEYKWRRETFDSD